jgi:hypothetical protein
MKYYASIILAIFSVSAIVGCGGGVEHSETVPVSGTVTWNGDPLKTGRVQFVPNDPKNGRPAVGDLDQDGNYKLMTFQADDGAMPGSYKILVNAMTEGDPDDFKTRGGTQILPQKYYDPNSSGLTASIEESDENKVVDLTLEGQRKK